MKWIVGIGAVLLTLLIIGSIAGSRNSGKEAATTPVSARVLHTDTGDVTEQAIRAAQDKNPASCDAVLKWSKADAESIIAAAHPGYPDDATAQGIIWDECDRIRR